MYGDLSHCQRVLRRLEIGPLNPLQSWRELGVYRLAARVHDLREQGYAIGKDSINVENRYGETCRVAQYTLTSPEPLRVDLPPQQAIRAMLSSRAQRLF